MMSTPLSPPLFASLSALVEERLGIHYGVADNAVFSGKIALRMREAGFERPLDYYYFLRYDAAAVLELEALADTLVVGETYFFRELTSLQAGVEQALLPAIERRGRARAWSAACSTGEEPLSLSMVLEEAGIRDCCEIVATDVSAGALRKAREGDYGPRSLRALPPGEPPSGYGERLANIAAATLRRDGKRAKAVRSHVESINYMQLNLLDEAAVLALGTFDLILCRNVLIYFADSTVSRVVASLSRALSDGGRLVVGVSESLLRFGTTLRCEERAGAFLYARETS